MTQELNKLVQLMKDARKKSEKANTRAYDLRQQAIRLQFEAASATEAAAMIAETVKDCKDPRFLAAFAETGKQAALRVEKAAIQAVEAAEKADAAEKEVIEAFHLAREAAANLAEVLKGEVAR
jgi:hypothetical protein